MAVARAAALLRRVVMAEGGEAVTLPSVRHTSSSVLGDDLATIGVDRRGPVLIVVGGASKDLSPEAADARRRLVKNVVVPVARASGAIVITGGTDAGIMSEVGRSLAEHSPETILIGVAPESMLVGFGAEVGAVDAAAPEVHHRIVRTDGSSWGAEAPVLIAVAEQIAESGIAMLAVGGGEGTRREIALALTRRWPVLLTQGLGGESGELAEELARSRGALRSRAQLVQRLRAAMDSGEVRVQTAERPLAMARALRWALSDDPLLREAWARFSFADSEAVRLRVPTGWGARGVIVLASLTVLLGLIVRNTTEGSGQWVGLKVALTAAPLAAAVVLALLERSARAGTWVSMRGAAESTLREIYRFRTGAPPYENGEKRLLAESMAGVDARAGLRIAEDAGIRHAWPPAALDQRIPDADQLLDALDPATYDLVRAQDQLAFLARTAKKKSRYALGWSLVAYTAGAVAALALSVSWWKPSASPVAAGGASVVAAVVSWRLYQRWDEDADTYRATAIEIRAARARWLAMSSDPSCGDDASTAYPAAVEDALSAEGTEWERSVRQAQAGFMQKHGKG